MIEQTSPNLSKTAVSEFSFSSLDEGQAQIRVVKFIAAVLAIASHLRESDIAVTAFFGKQPSRFISLGEKEQLLALKNAEDLLLNCEAALRMNHRIHDDAFSMLWFMLKKFGLRFPSDLFTHLESTDIVEIYGPDHVQMFRSFNMFSFITYSLEDIFTHNWTELWGRPPELIHRMWTVANEIFQGKHRGIVKFDIPDHLVTEVFSNAKRETYMNHRFALPLHSSDGRVAALMNVLRPIEVGAVTKGAHEGL